MRDATSGGPVNRLRPLHPLQTRRNSSRIASRGLGSRGYDLLVWSSDSSPQRIQVRTVHSAPWYVRRSSFVGSRADHVTVYVLLGVERRVKSPRFFVVKNSDLAAQFRQPPNWNAFGFIDAKTVEHYEDNWGILR